MGKKGGGGGGQAPTVNVPAGIYNTIGSTSGLGQYASNLLNPLASMTNWAANLASGGTAGQIPSFQSAASQAGPNVSFSGAQGGGKGQWASSFDPTTGLITYTNSGMGGPQQQFTMSINDYNPAAQVTSGSNSNPGAFGDLPNNILAQWSSDYAQHQSQGQGSATPGKPTDVTSQLGPFLGTAWNAIQAQTGLPAQMTPVEQQTTALANEAQAEGSSLMGQGQSELTMATTGSGLFPSQQALIDQTKQTGETEQAAMLAKLGLSSSTMAPQLKEQADLAADATAGQLVQGNISAAQNTIALGQASQKIALGGQALETTEQQAVFDMYSSIANESTAFQKNLWDEALSGYGMLGNLIDTSAKSYGQSLSGYGAIIQAESASAQNQTALEQAAQQADSSSTSSLFGALGSIVGGSGGLLSSLGGAAGGAAAGAGAAAGGSGAIAGIGGALTALFCQVAQTVYGFDDPRWEQFRAWLLLRAPLWFVRLYGRYAQPVSEWLEDKPLLRWCLSHVFDCIAKC